MPASQEVHVPAIMIALAALPVIAGLLFALTRMESSLSSDDPHERP